MNIDHELLHVAKEVVEQLDKQADNLLPKAIVDVVKTHSKLAVASSGFLFLVQTLQQVPQVYGECTYALTIR